MTFLPVIERELRAVARNSRLYWTRASAALASFVLIAWFWLTTVNAASPVNAMTIFATISTFAFVYALAGGVFLTADCISEEKREGTLGLLFLTDLSGVDVTLGKLAASSLRAVYALIAIFPILTIPLLLGGIELREVERMALVLLVTLMFSTSAGLLVSSWSRQDRKAQFGALGLVLAYSLGLPATAATLGAWHIHGFDFAYMLSPVYGCWSAFSAEYKKHPETFWVSVSVTQALTWLAIAGAAAITRNAWRDRPEKQLAGGWFERFRTWRRGSEGTRRRYRTQLLNLNPCYWLAARDRLKPWYVLWLFPLAALLWAALCWHNPREMLELEAFFGVSVILHAVIKTWLASETGRQLHEERKSGALELTLSTPLKVNEILEGHFFALARQFGPAIALVLAIDLAGIVISATRQFGGESSGILTLIAMAIVFLADCAAIAVQGMWLGLSYKRSGRAVVQTLFYIIGVPWLVILGLLTLIGLAGVTAIDSMNVFIGGYLVISLVTALIFFLNAASNLTGRFREVATTRFE